MSTNTRKKSPKRGSSAEPKILSDLRRQFPDTQVEAYPGIFINIRPLPIRLIPSYMNTFAKAYLMMQGGAELGDVVESVGERLVDMIDACILDEGVSVDNLPSPLFPKLAQVVIEMNLDEETRKNWESLINEVTGGQEEGGDQTESPLKKQPASSRTSSQKQ